MLRLFFTSTLFFITIAWFTMECPQGKAREWEAREGKTGKGTEGFFSSSVLIMNDFDWHKSSNKACFGLGRICLL